MNGNRNKLDQGGLGLYKQRRSREEVFNIQISELDPKHLTRDQMTNLLFEGISDDGQNGDCILVFGSSQCLKYRLPKAIELYRSGRAAKILCSGGMTWDNQHQTEAEIMRDKALELGISTENLLVEKESRNTKENILASLLVLDRAFQLHNVRRIIAVTATYHMKRTHLTLKTYMPEWISFSLCPVDNQTTGKNNWWLNRYGRKRVREESRKIIEYVRMGAIKDDLFPE